MERFRLGEWRVDPEGDRISRAGQTVHLQPQVMNLLVYLAEKKGEVVSAEELLTQVWEDRVVTQASVYSGLKQLREALGDDANAPRYIETIPKRGYRLIASVEPEAEGNAQPPALPANRDRLRPIAGALILVVLLSLYLFQSSRDEAEPGPRTVQPVSLAILPFTDHTEDGSGSQLAGGLHEELLTRTARLPQLRVISRTSVMAFADTPSNLREIAAELGADMVIEGGVQREDDQLRVFMQLIDSRSDAHLWARRFERELTEISLFDVQSEVASAVATALELELTPVESRRLLEPPTRSFEAYEAFLLGQHEIEQRNVPALRRAAGHYAEAIELDADFALAHTRLGDTYDLMQWYGEEPADELKRKARAAIDRALQLDPRLGEAHASLGNWIWTSDIPAAIASFERSLELNPSYAPAHHWYGELLKEAGRLAEALDRLQVARRIDPMSAIINLENALLLERLGRFDEARERYEAVARLDPGYRDINYSLGALQIAAFGRFDRALPYLLRDIEIFSRTEEPLPGYLAQTYFNLAFYLFHLGLYEQALEVAALASEQEGNSFNRDLYAAYVWLARTAPGPQTPVSPELGALNAWLDSGDIDPVQRYNILYLNLVFNLRTGQPEASRTQYERIFPNYFTDTSVRVDSGNLKLALDIAKVLALTGDRAAADRMFGDCQRVIRSLPRMGSYGYGILDVQIFAMQGAPGQAMSALEAAIQAGWRETALFDMAWEPGLASLHGDPRYGELMATVEADLSEQRSKVADSLEAAGFSAGAAPARKPLP